MPIGRPMSDTPRSLLICKGRKPPTRRLRHPFRRPVRTLHRYLLNKRTYEVSGGQAQRAAIARAVIHAPSLLLADEPTGNLDSKASRDVMEMLVNINRSRGTTTMMVTHDALAASYCHRVIFIKDGRFYNEIRCGQQRQAFYQHIIDMKALSKIGLTETEMSASMTIQVIILFFAPFLMAVLNTVFFAIVIKNNLHTDAHVFVPMVATTGFFLALQAIYFFVVRAQHLSQLKQALI
jgi:ABC-type proline/glycine betaine transport system ATPase subunit